jgi:hypothetical protein
MSVKFVIIYARYVEHIKTNLIVLILENYISVTSAIENSDSTNVSIMDPIP